MRTHAKSMTTLAVNRTRMSGKTAVAIVMTALAAGGAITACGTVTATKDTTPPAATQPAPVQSPTESPETTTPAPALEPANGPVGTTFKVTETDSDGNSTFT